MANPYKVKFYHYEDSYGIEVGHVIQNDTKENGIEVEFRAYDLCECPEDATLNRDLFNGYEYISALELGMKLAQLEYDSIEVEHIGGDEEDNN